MPDRVLLADLRKTAKRLGKSYIGFAEYEKEGEFHPSTLEKRFGGWNAAADKAGLKLKKRWRISTDELLNNLKKVWDTLGRQPRGYELRKPLSKYLYINYFRRFGSWNRALAEFANKFNNRKCNTANQEANKKLRYKHYRHANIIKRFINKSMRFDVFRRDNFKCMLCGASPATDSKVTLHADHIIPASKGGETTLKNLQTLCKDCNLGKGAKSINK